MARARIDATALRDLARLLEERWPRQPSALVSIERRLLVVLRDLLRSDAVFFNDLAPEAESGWGSSHTLGELELSQLSPAADDRFYEHFWSSSCSYPDRTGDWVTPHTLSDFSTLRERHRGLRPNDEGPSYDRELLLPFPSAPGHSRRLRFIRYKGSDFDDTDRALANLIRPSLASHLHALDLDSRGVTPLTRRQRELMSLVATGRTNLQAARDLGISAGTVRIHLQQIYKRLDVNSRGEAVAVLHLPADVGPGVRARRGESSPPPSRAG